MLILRIEDVHRNGCYSVSNRTSRETAMRAHDFGNCMLTTDAHPEPHQDTKLSSLWRMIRRAKHPSISSLHVRFGFTDVAQYFEWFYTARARQILRELGYYISIYEVPQAYVELGSTQCVFDMRHAISITQAACDLGYECLETLLNDIATARG
jgi:hypothetical protein